MGVASDGWWWEKKVAEEKTCCGWCSARWVKTGWLARVGKWGETKEKVDRCVGTGAAGNR